MTFDQVGEKINHQIRYF